MPLRCLLAFFWVLLGCSWSHLGSHDASVLDFGWSWAAPGWVLANSETVFATIFEGDALIAAGISAWHAHWHFVTSLQRGGTCAAHGIRFLKAFLACFFPIANLHRFFAAFLQNVRVFSKADLQNSCAHAVFRGPPHHLTLFEKITRNHRKTFPKSFPNPSQNLEKSIQNRKKTLQKGKIT